MESYLYLQDVPVLYLGGKYWSSTSRGQESGLVFSALMEHDPRFSFSFVCKIPWLCFLSV